MGVVKTSRRDNAKGLDDIVASSKRGKPTLFAKLLSRELGLDLNYVGRRCEELAQR
jgi:hypothetical protein